MARPPKGEAPAPPGKDESWENIEEGWESIDTDPRAPRDEPEGPSVWTGPMASPSHVDEKGLERQTTQVDPPPDGRELPVAPPGHRAVSKTIVGVGMDLHSLMKAEEVVRGGPARRLESSAGQGRTFATPPPEELATVRTPTPPEFPVARTPSDEIVTVVRHEGEADGGGVTPVHTEMTPLGRTDPLPAVPRTEPLLADAQTEPLLADAQTDPISVPDLIQTPSPTPAPAPEPPRPAARPANPSAPRPIVSSRFRPPETSRVDHGPSNFTLALLWAVAIASVGLAVFLYATR